jgi:hypothetical protein
LKEKYFPKKISESERAILFSLLPENKSGYQHYRKLLEHLVLIGEGRFGNGNLILGEAKSVVNLSIPSSHVFAFGNIYSSSENYYAVIHTIDDGMIEVQIDPYPIKDNLLIEKVVSYSDWKPGMKSPERDSEVFEYMIKENEYDLAICPLSKKIWLHEFESGVNYIIPLSNFFNELMRVRNVKDEKLLTNPAIFFSQVNTFSEMEIKLAFLLYNKYLRHFDLGDALEKLISEKDKRKRSFKLFGRGLN